MSLGSKIRMYFSMWRRILELSRRPSEEEFNLLLKLNLLGFVVVGGIAYIIHLIAVLLGG
jgi:protein transport protein SEC61 subunit gamma-like protein